MIPQHKTCNGCKFQDTQLGLVRGVPFLGSAPCHSCIRFPDSRTDKWQSVSSHKINKDYLATLGDS